MGSRGVCTEGLRLHCEVKDAHIGSSAMFYGYPHQRILLWFPFRVSRMTNKGILAGAPWIGSRQGTRDARSVMG